MKKTICLFLALAALLGLMAACKDTVIGPEEATTRAVGDDELNQEKNKLGELDAAAEAALRELLEKGYTVPEETQPPETMPPTMPNGVEVDAAAARALMQKVLETFNTGRFMMKMRSSSPFMAGGNTATPLTVAMSDGMMAFEMEMDWVSLFMSEGQSAIMARIQAGTTQGLFGKRMRIITKPEGVIIAFVDKKMYMPMGDGSEEGGEPIEFDLSSALGEAFGGAKTPQETEEKLRDLKSSKVSSGGKEYLCAEMTMQDAEGNPATIRYFFLGDELKRVEAGSGAENMMWEIESFTGQVDPAFFSTDGMSTMPLDQLGELGGSFGDLFGGAPAATAG